MAITAAVSLCLSGCTSWFFYPSRASFGSPAEVDIRFRDIYLPVDQNVKLHGWLLQPDDESPESRGEPPVGSIYFLHGNAENITSHSRAIYWLVKAGWEVFALDYRGYGQSQGQSDLPLVFDDIDIGARWLVEHRQQRSADTPLVLLGQSLGASLAIHYIASDRSQAKHFQAVVAEAAFSGYGEIAQHVASRNWLTWAFQWPVRWLLAGPYDPVDSVAAMAPRPILIVHSRQDQIIPFDHAERLYRASSEPRRFLATDGPHIAAFANDDVRDQVLGFLSELPEPSGARQ